MSEFCFQTYAWKTYFWKYAVIFFSILKCSPFNRTGFRPKTFTFEWISGPCRPFQCLASKFLNFYKFSSWSYLIVQAFGPSGCSNVDDDGWFIRWLAPWDTSPGVVGATIAQPYFWWHLSCLQCLVHVFLLTINRDYYYW